MSGTTKIVFGKVHQIKGIIKNAVGSLIRDKKMELKGNDETMYGKIQVKLGHIENNLPE
ncbi:CsbD family protein [Desulfolutivibrio sulfoxidireducens]|uniref:CsbD family protein n=1 Tax=Desulfolutivibrio sulfoxidireducens TaxID=2773299 RepID=UPI00159DB1F3|nr:CsbD family protein [Desulfolutivibrio sulfoxidireducens]QLA15739.1 CsbD family protein [Desulfolutivibrio sulfoxidireducens]